MTIEKIFTYPIAYFMTLVGLYTVYDFFEHILRPGSSFEAHPWHWLLFSGAAIGSLLMVTLLIKIALQKIFKQQSLVLEVVAIGIWLALYILFLGPLLNKFFWTFDQLYFSFNFGPFFILLGGYFIVRLLINLMLRKTALYSK